MPTLGASTSWFGMTVLGMSCVAFGYTLRHLWGFYANRANVIRISALCDQLDAKDDMLESLRIKLHEEHIRVDELEAQLASSHAPTGRPAGSVERHSSRTESVDDELSLRRDNEYTKFSKLRVRTPGNRSPLDVSPVRRLGRTATGSTVPTNSSAQPPDSTPTNCPTQLQGD